jgi:hypothetical protein
MQTLTIIGNGPSTKDVDFDRLAGDTVALNGAYRKIGDWDWKPNLYCLFDAVLVNTHRVGIVEYIDKNPEIRFFSSAPLPNATYVHFNTTWHRCQHIPLSLTQFYDCHDTGATTALLGFFLGYEHIRLIGIDANHKIAKEAASIGGEQYMITSAPKDNNNYWFDEYQQEGDVFNRPNLEAKDTWANIGKVADRYGKKVTNHSSISEVEAFEVRALEELYE